jgi:hypothetical protein
VDRLQIVLGEVCIIVDHKLQIYESELEPLGSDILLSDHNIAVSGVTG